VRINYDDLIDKGNITHSGQTIGVLLDKISKPNSSPPVQFLSDLQPYLEPFSFVCNEILTAARAADISPYLNIVADYPVGSRQPAWAALFREGRYQLFVGDGKVRLFLEGKDPAILFNQYYSVIRHPLKDTLAVFGKGRLTVEVYAFENDYAARTISLDLNPYVLEVAADQLGPKPTELPLADLANFFTQDITLEAGEIDGNGNFYLYGTPSARRTVAGRPQSLEDFAVVYRSMFHYGHNAPYISLDRHEDNRYAKVNFGGLLEDTRVGSVVLEADKLFKTLSVGLDPNTRASARSKIRSAVPEFVTEDERALQLEESKDKTMQIRYWFYPDRISTVTDGPLGVVENSQFMADAERLDADRKNAKATLGRAQRETIDHLNGHFDRYAAALPTYHELSTVGRMMAIAKWIQQHKARNTIDFDALLSVDLSAFQTPRRTKKLLAITAQASGPGKAAAAETAVRKVYSFDSLVAHAQASMTDDEFLALAEKQDASSHDPELVPPQIRRARATLASDRAQLSQMKARLELLNSKIERDRSSLDRYNEYAVNQFNALVNEYRSLQGEYSHGVDAFNASIPTDAERISIRTIVSIGGGINLRPQSFAAPRQVPESPLIKSLRSSREIVRSSPARSGGRILRPTQSAGGPVGNVLAARKWVPASDTSTTSTGNQIRRHWSNDQHGSMSVEANTQSGYTHIRVAMPQYFLDTTIQEGKKELVMASSSYPAQILATGEFSPGGNVVLHRGTTINQPLSRIDQRHGTRESWVRSGQATK
jgi:hypothetical protein